jgi:hypothetical protein
MGGVKCEGNLTTADALNTHLYIFKSEKVKVNWVLEKIRRERHNSRAE